MSSLWRYYLKKYKFIYPSFLCQVERNYFAIPSLSKKRVYAILIDIIQNLDNIHTCI